MAEEIQKLLGAADTNTREAVETYIQSLKKGQQSDEEEKPSETELDGTVGSTSTSKRRILWNLRKEFVKEQLDIQSMKGSRFDKWLRQFKSFLEEAGFRKYASNAQSLRALEMCTTEETYEKIQGLIMALPSEEIDSVLEELGKMCENDGHLWSHRKTFKECKHSKGMPFVDYLLRLGSLALKCKFGSKFCESCKVIAKDEFLLYQAVLGTCDIELQTEFLKKESLDLEMVKKIATKFESIRSAQCTLSGENTAQFQSIQGVQENPNHHSIHLVNNDGIQCYSCLKYGHKSGDNTCPALNSECKKCGRRGHWYRACRSQNQYQNQRGGNQRGRFMSSRGRGFRPAPRSSNAVWFDSDANYYLSGAVVNAVSTKTKFCEIQCSSVGGIRTVRGLIDTGSDWISGGHKHMVDFGVTEEMLMKPTKEMCQTYVANGTVLKCHGYIVGEFKWKQKTVKDRVVFFDQFPNILFSKDLLIDLGIVTINIDQSMDNTNTTPIPCININTVIPSREDLIIEFQDVFDERDEPMDCEPLRIELTEDVVPTRISAARNIPISLKEPLTRELKTQERNGLIRRISRPTEWCSPVVVVPKKGSAAGTNHNHQTSVENETVDVRVAPDYRALNKYVKRAYFQSMPPLQLVQSVVSEDAKLFSVLDCWKGYHQQALHEDSIDLTTFICPFNLGRWQYLRAPFGVSNISEVYDQQMTDMLDDLSNHKRLVDDNLIHSKDAATHAQYVRNFLQRCREKKIRISEKKFVYMAESVEFAGYQLSKEGYSIQPKVISAIQDFPVPKNKTDLMSFQGMANQLAPMNKDLTRALNPLRDLLKRDRDFVFDEVHLEAFDQAKGILSSTAVIAFYRPNAPLQLFTDASTLNGLGFVLKQKQPDGSWKPIQVGSRTLTGAESHYAPIELELTALVFATSKCRSFLAGAPHFLIFTDQKPLVTIVNKRRLDEISNRRILRLLLRLMDFNFTVEYIRGSANIAADCFSRYPTSPPSPDDCRESDELRESGINAVRATCQEVDVSIRLKKVKDIAQDDPSYQSLMAMIIKGFPEHKNQLPDDLREFWIVRDDLTLSDDGFILYKTRLLIPKKLRSEMLDELHRGHKGIESIRSRARMVIYWPNIDNHIMQHCQSCEKCFVDRPSLPKEPLIHLPVPDRPFQFVSCDLFEIAGQKGVVYTDWKSGHWSWAFPLKSTDSRTIIPIIRKFFTNTASPDVFFSDGGPPFNSYEFEDFMKRWGINHKRSSARYPQSNSYAELAVKNCTALLEKYWKGHAHTDWETFDRAMLQIRNTPHASSGLSPAMILYGHPIQDTIPAHKSMFNKDWHNVFLEADRKFSENKQKLEDYYNQGAKELPPISVGTPVAIQSPNKRWDCYGVVQESNHKIRRYLIRLASGVLVTRNRRFIRERFTTNGPIMPTISDLELEPRVNEDVSKTLVEKDTDTTNNHNNDNVEGLGRDNETNPSQDVRLSPVVPRYNPPRSPRIVRIRRAPCRYGWSPQK